MCLITSREKEKRCREIKSIRIDDLVRDVKGD